jgi:aspartyl-tRNA synthetase
VRPALTAEEWDELRTKFRMRKEFPLQAIRIPKAGDISGTERRTIGTYGSYPHVQGPLFVQLMTDPKRFAKDYPALSEKILHFAKIEPDDLWLLAGAADRPENAAVVDQSVERFCEKCGFLRLDLAQKYAAKHKAFEKSGRPDEDFRFLWVSDFPMFEWDQDEKRWNPAHHPFTSLHEEDMAKLEANLDSVDDPKSPLGEIRALAYDVVLNGTELGSGSIRIHRQDIQKKIFQALGMSTEEARARFGFFLEALEYGTPPHGGIALGLDRIVMILAGAESLREVIPFPKTARAVDLMVDAPTPVSEAQLRELGIQVKKA